MLILLHTLGHYWRSLCQYFSSKTHKGSTGEHTECNLYVYTGAHSVSNVRDHRETAAQMCLHRHCSLTLSDPPLSYHGHPSAHLEKLSKISLWICIFFIRDPSNMQTDKCLEVNHGWGSHESDVGYVIVLCSVPPGKTMRWSAHVTSVFLRWHKNNGLLSKYNHHMWFSAQTFAST